jgi:hypothetical protein|tara:strand:- start:1840 stop:2292 length:453 start_codon:yes stop_codon:yes gene_type:complete
MSHHTYGANNIAFSSFDIWANNVSSDTNAQLDAALSDFYPAQSAPFSANILRNTDIFYGSVTAGTGGQVSLSAPYTVSATSSFQVKNMDLGENNPVIVATATYPYDFDSWRTADGGGGSQISTNSSLTITTSTTQVTNFYAYFTTTHSSP